VLLARVALFFYWICDNLQIVTQLKLRKGDAEYWGQMGMINWTISLICNLIQFVREYMQASTQLIYYESAILKNPEKRDSFRDQIKAMKKQRFSAILGLIKTFGDLLPAAKGASTIISNPRYHR
jgi:uncharacterized membrane protein YwzB